jgi:hypothetical protein
MQARLVALFVAVALAGCASGPGIKNRSVARGVLIGLAVATAGAAIGSAVVSQRKEDDLRKEIETTTLTGRQFAERDAQGMRWNRIARASAFASGLAVVGLLVLWEMSVGDRIQNGPLPETPPAAATLRLPPPSAALPAQSWATAR